MAELELYECGVKKDIDAIKLAFAGEEVAKRGGVIYFIKSKRLPIYILCNTGEPHDYYGTHQTIFIPSGGNQPGDDNPIGEAFYVNPERKIFTSGIVNYNDACCVDTAHITDRYELIGDPRELIVELYLRGYLPVLPEKYIELD
jgi:hypothetical protein